ARTGNVQLQATAGASSLFSQHYHFTIDGTRVYSDAIHESTTSAAANMRIDGSATILRSTSSRRYKLDIEDARQLDSVLDIRPRTWIDAAERSRYESGSERQQHEPRRHFGAIAEEVEELGLTELIEYNEDGEPESIAYDRLGVALLPVVKSLMQRVEALE